MEWALQVFFPANSHSSHTMAAHCQPCRTRLESGAPRAALPQFGLPAYEPKIPVEALGYWLYDTFWLAQHPKFPLLPRLFSSAGTKRVRIIAGARIDASFPFSPAERFHEKAGRVERGNAHSAPQRTSQPSARPGRRRQCPGAKRSRQGAAQPRGLDGAEPRLALGPQAATRPLAALQRVPWSVGLPLSDGNFCLKNRARNEVRNEARFETRNEVRNGARRRS